MDEDTERFRKALAKTGNTVGSVGSDHDADAALRSRCRSADPGGRGGSEAGRAAAALLKSPVLAGASERCGCPARPWPAKRWCRLRRPGARAAPGQRHAAGPGRPDLPDNTGEVDPLEAQSSPANALAFSPDGTGRHRRRRQDRRHLRRRRGPRAPLHRPHGVGLGRGLLSRTDRACSPAARTEPCASGKTRTAPRTSYFSRSRRFSDMRGLFAGRPPRSVRLAMTTKSFCGI